MGSSRGAGTGAATGTAAIRGTEAGDPSAAAATRSSGAEHHSIEADYGGRSTATQSDVPRGACTEAGYGNIAAPSKGTTTSKEATGEYASAGATRDTDDSHGATTGASGGGSRRYDDTHTGSNTGRTSGTAEEGSNASQGAGVAGSAAKGFLPPPESGKPAAAFLPPPESGKLPAAFLPPPESGETKNTSGYVSLILPCEPELLTQLADLYIVPA